MRRLQEAPDVVRIAKDLGLSEDDPVDAILHHCRETVTSWVTSLKGSLTLSRFHQLLDTQLELSHIVVNSDQELDTLIAAQTGRGELIFNTLRQEFAGGTEAITFKLQNRDIGMRRHLAVIDGRGDRAARVYFAKRHEGSHILTLSPRQLSFVFRRTHAIKNAAEEQLMDRISAELAFYSPIFKPELNRFQQQYDKPCFDLVKDLRNWVCPDASWTATAIAMVEQNDVPALFLTATYGAKIGDSGPAPSSWALRSNARSNQAARLERLFIPWNYRVPSTSLIYRAFHDSSGLIEHEADERLGLWTASNGSRLPDFPIHVEARKHGSRISAIITLN